MVGQQPFTSPSIAAVSPTSDDAFTLLQLAGLPTRLFRLIAGESLAVGVLRLAGTYQVKPTFTAVTPFLSPQPQQNPSALALLGGPASLPGTRSPADQYDSRMRSATVMDKIVDRFRLIELYEVKRRVDACNRLDASIRMNVGKNNEVIAVEVDNIDTARAAAMANAFVDEIEEISKGLALLKAQQCSAIFEEQFARTRARLVEAQSRLQASGFNAGATKAAPKSAAKADATEVRLRTLLQTPTVSSPEIQALRVQFGVLQSKLRATEASGGKEKGSAHIGANSEFGYLESLHELFVKQFEAAKLDESRDSTLFQVFDKATPPEKKSKPRPRLSLPTPANQLLALVGP